MHQMITVIALAITHLFACDLRGLGERGKQYEKLFAEDLKRLDSELRAVGCAKTDDQAHFLDTCDQKRMTEVTALYKKRVEKSRQRIIDIEASIHGCSFDELNENIKIFGSENSQVVPD